MSEHDHVTVTITLDSQHVVHAVHITGHAGTELRGSNVACGAVSLLAKAAYETLRELKRVPIEGDAPEPGKLWFEVGVYETKHTEQLRGITNFLIKGFTVVQREYPEAVQVVIQYTGG